MDHLKRFAKIVLGLFGLFVVVVMGIGTYGEYVVRPAERARVASCRDRAMKASLDGVNVAVVFIHNMSISYKRLDDDFCNYSQFDVATPEQIAAYEKRQRNDEANIEAERRAFKRKLNEAREAAGSTENDQPSDGPAR